MDLILASNSPRRKDILEKFGYVFQVVKSKFLESEVFSDPVKTVINFAKGKALDVFNGFDDKRKAIILGADTVVFADGKILGKPKTVADAKSMLQSLSRKEHRVITGFAVVSEKIRVFGYDVSKVVFNTLSKELIDDYVKSGKPFDKAGGYGIQDGYNLVKDVYGSINNVIGLPIEKIKPILDGFL